MNRRELAWNGLRGLVTDTDLPQAEREWPGLQEYLRSLPGSQRPATFLELIWRFERSRQQEDHPAWAA
jgi:hypothetical protein